ncbi:bestrophin family protein [Rufibacter sediminis]|uniref:Bestrophin family protein n=1 Tax=Rufibacter sediminis TaxID=2762756 RepID=A0ABR6VQ78_9BACT|nr:bestrophin family protein [Rufibacter sediminis]MBC3539338.1 bestrophin family protein [Rufibacter sediminis]
MVNYNPKEWFIFIFRFSRSDTSRRLLPLLCAVGAYAGLVAYIELNHPRLFNSTELKNVGLMHSVLGFVISLLLVFRTNTAYDRWWEGRKIWGSLTNSSRNLALKLQACLPDPEDRHFFRKTIPSFALALKTSLRQNEDYHDLDPVLDLNPAKHMPNQIASAIFRRVNELHVSGAISTGQLMILDQEIKVLTEVTGASERIKNTPIPFTYSVFIKKFIFLYVMTLPFGWAYSMGYFVIPVVMLILYAMASLELIAEEIENPFGTDDNDLPLDQICQNIKKHVGELLE